MDYLLDHGAGINMTSVSGRTALVEACYSGCLEVGIAPAFEGADPMAKQHYGLLAMVPAQVVPRSPVC